MNAYKYENGDSSTSRLIPEQHQIIQSSLSIYPLRT
jgi:hypothetical protein